MPFPLLGASLGGVFITSLTAFFATRIPVILVSLGLSAVVYSGADVLVQNIISSVQSSASGVGSINVFGISVNAVGIMAGCGVFDAINIVLSGYTSVALIKTTKVALQAISK